MARRKERWYRYRLVFASDIEPLMVEDAAQAARVLRQLYPNEKNVRIVPIEPICVRSRQRCLNRKLSATITLKPSSDEA